METVLAGYRPADADGRPTVAVARLPVDRAPGAVSDRRWCCRPTVTEITGPMFGDRAGDAGRGRPHPPARRRAAGRADHRDGPGARRRRPTRSPQPWSSSGRPMPPAATRLPADGHPAPLDPNFTGAGRCLTDDDGGYRFVTVKPGAYPWRNHANAWRPAHLHFSLFGPSFSTRLVTQMYFPGDPLVRPRPDRERRPRPGRPPADGLGLRPVGHRAGVGARATAFDIVLRGRRGHADGDVTCWHRPTTPSQTVGPFFQFLIRRGRGTGGRTRPPGRHPARGPGARRRGSPGTRRHARAVAGRCRRVGTPIPTTPPRRLRPGVHGLRPGRVPTPTAATASSPMPSPAPVPAPDGGGLQAPHLAMSVFARGLLDRVVTRVYFSGRRRSRWPPTRCSPWSTRRPPVDVGRRGRCRTTPTRYRFDIRLQGDGETVFFEV